MRAVDLEGLQPDAEWYEAIDSCIGCLGCETACPSSVPYGDLIAATRAAVSADHPPPWRLRVGLQLLSWPRLLRWGSGLLAVFQRFGLLRRTGMLPRQIPLRGATDRGRSSKLHGPVEVVLFTGCVMDAWQPEVHEAVETVLSAAGVSMERSGDRVGCCGALHEHAGLVDEARGHARRVVTALCDDHPILVDSAGCGAALKHYGELLGTPEAQAFSARVRDVHEWCAADPRVLAVVDEVADEWDRPTIVVQDPCHLRHVQRAHGSVRDLLERIADLVELDDEGLCCGAGGAYQMLWPELATATRARKVAAVHRARRGKTDLVLASANPGCAIHLSGDPSLAEAGVVVRHPMEVLAAKVRAVADKADTTDTETTWEADHGG